jgi:hypothetical protein
MSEIAAETMRTEYLQNNPESVSAGENRRVVWDSRRVPAGLVIGCAAALSLWSCS